MSQIKAGPRPITLFEAFCAVVVVAAILLGGVAVAWLAGATERSGVDLMIAGRLIGL